MASRSFGQPVYTRREMEEAVGSYTARAAEKMCRQKLVTAQIVVFIHTNRFRPQDAPYHATQAISLPVATAATGKLISAGRRALDAIWRSGPRYKKAGVMILDLHTAADQPVGLFVAPETPTIQEERRFG